MQHEERCDEVVPDADRHGRRLEFDGRRHATHERDAPEGWSRPDVHLEAALERKLQSAGAAGSAANSPLVESWAHQLGLKGTALLTTVEAAPLLRICERSVRQGIKEGRIPHVRLGRRLLIPVPRLLAMLLEEGDDDG